MRVCPRIVLAVVAGVVLGSACTPPQVRYQPVVAAGLSTGPIEATLFLVGDAGEINPHSAAVLAHLQNNVESVAARDSTRPVVVAFLGDNIYEVGARPEYEAADQAILDAQIAAVGNHPMARAVFVPGNHDWSDGGADDRGRASVRLQQDWVERRGADRNVAILPADACPGPAHVDIATSVRLLFIDTEWLLRQPHDDCGSPEDFYERLRLVLEQSRGRRVVVLSHHPLASGGPHGGHVALLERGPFVYYLVRKSGANAQDMTSRAYSDMIRGIEGAFAAGGTRPLLHAAGHDHTLQVIRMPGPEQAAYQLVSGAGSRSTNSRRIEGTRYAANGYGYMRVEFDAVAAQVTVYARSVDGGPVAAVFTCSLSTAGPDEECPEAPRADSTR